MSESNHLKCPCLKCGGAIEFPAPGVGLSATCPHCGAETKLFAVAKVETPGGSDAPGDSSPLADASLDSEAVDDVASAFDGDDNVASHEPAGSKWKLLGAVFSLLALAAAALFIFKDRLAGSRSPELRGVGSATNLEMPRVAAGTPTNAPLAPKVPKSMDDFKVGPITLEKSKGSSLVYAIGVLRNDSAHQRFGVNLELDLIDARGNKAGTAKDYRAVLEPRQEWRFRALVLESKAVLARVASIREEE